MGRLYDATWARGFAAVYDRVTRATEENGMRDMRREVLAAARGRTLDLGAGTGGSLGLYPDDVTELVLAEPGPHMAKRLRRKVEEMGIPADVVEAPAERLPFEDSSFDTAVFTLVLCTVPRPDQALAEVRRVLRPEGRMLFIEHVRSEDPRAARWQDRLERPWAFLAAGCHPNRDTVAAIELAGLRIERLERTTMPKGPPPPVKPLVLGAAVNPAA